MDDIIYFEFNTWSEKGIPNDPRVLDLFVEDEDKDINNIKVLSREWLKNNPIIVVLEVVDMSLNFCVTTTRGWVMDNIPSLLDNEKNHRFLRTPDKDNVVKAWIGTCNFLHYDEDFAGHAYLYNPNNGTYEEYPYED